MQSYTREYITQILYTNYFEQYSLNIIAFLLKDGYFKYVPWDCNKIAERHYEPSS